MKKKRNKLIVLVGSGIIFLVLLSIFILNYSKDDSSYSILEKKWISDNSRNIIDINVYNDVPVYGKGGNGVIFDFLDDFTTKYGVNYNKISYYVNDDDTLKDNAFRVLKSDVSLSKNDILMYEDNYVLISNKEREIDNISDIDNLEVMVLSSDLQVVSSYLGNIETIPVGVFKDSLNIATLNCNKNYSTIVSSNDISEYNDFIKNLYEVFKSVNDISLSVIDTTQTFSSNEVTNLINNKFDETLNSLLQDMSDNYIKYRDSNYDNTIFEGQSKKVVFILGLTELLSRLSVDKKNEFTTALAMIKDLGLYHIVIIDNNDKLKQQTYEQWYKEAIDSSNGVWLGNNVLDQTSLKLSMSPRELREELEVGFGVLVYKGKPYVMKLLGGVEDE